MMSLNRRYRRNIRSSMSFYVSAAFLTAISVFMLVVLYTSISMIDSDFKKLMEKGNVEHAQFKTLKEIDKKGIINIENTYDAEMEKVHYVDIEQNGYTLRVFAPMKKVNRYELLEGSNISSDTEILVNRDFAKAKKIVIGDRFVIAGTQYTVSGLAVRPDYIYAQKDTTDFYLDKSLFGQVTMSSAAFEKLANAQSYYAIVYHRSNDESVRKYLYKNYFTMNYMPAEANNRIAMPREVGKQLWIIVGTLMPVMFAMICIIVAVVIGRKIKKEQKQIGTLVALGYRKGEIIRHYGVYAAIPGIIGSIIGIALGIVFLEPVCIYFATDYEQINYTVSLYKTALVMAAFIPTLLYMLTAAATVLRLLRKSAVQLLVPGAEDGKRSRRLLAKTSLSFARKFRLRSIVKHKSRTFVVIMGMFVGGTMCAFGMIMLDSCKFLINEGLSATGSYEYQYFLSTIETKAPAVGEPMLSVNFEAQGHIDLFTLSGLVEKPKYLKLITKSGREVEYGKYYLTSNAAALYGVKAGEDFTFVNILSTKKYTVKIADIIDDDMQCNLYTSRANVATLLGAPAQSYNVVMSDKRLALDKSKIFFTNSKESIKAQLENTMKIIMSFIYMMILFGAIMCIISVYLTVNMLIEENTVNISMLKVLGYRKNEINSLVLNTNHVLLPISFVLSLWFCIKVCEKMFEAFIAELNLYIEPTITIPSMGLCFLLLALSYFASLGMLRRKVNRIDMVESLKDNRD